MRRFLGALIAGLCALVLVLPSTAPPPSRAQAVDVYINITGGGTRKHNVAIPDFAVTAGSDTMGVAPLLASVAGAELTFAGLISVVAAPGSIIAGYPRAAT